MTSGFIYNKSSSIPIPMTPGVDNAPLGLKDVVFFLRIRWRWIALSTMAFLVSAIAYVATAKPVFVADTQLMVLPQTTGPETQRASAEEAFIEAQMEIANSSAVLGATAAALNLVDDPEFQDDVVSLKDRVKQGVMQFFANPTADMPRENPVPRLRSEKQKRLDAVIARLRGKVGFRRVGRSMILQISASAFSPEKAATIANTLAQIYIQKNIGMNGAAAKQYSIWLEGFVAEQRRLLTEAANALLTYKNNPREQFKLAELQSAADARRALFESTLTRLTEAKQRISYPVSDATIVSEATPPLSKARPRGGLIVTFAGAVGVGVGFMLAMIRHAGDRRIISSRQLAKATTLPFSLLLEKSRRTQRSRRMSFASILAQRHSPHQFPTARGMGELSTIVAGFRRRQRTIIGVVAIDSGDGATTIASEIAILSAMSGAPTLLIDAAGQTAGLSKWISPYAEIGIAEVLEAAALFSTASLPILPNLRFLPLGKPVEASPAVRFSSRRTHVTLQALKNDFDTVIIDLNAFTLSSDASAIGPELDGVLLVARYGHTSIDEATKAIESLRNVGTEILGMIINKTPARWLS
jgi:uncharacterized protein involved in exopolysaccharide biosynthesis/Mrp family chromosome partitioning ATPase